MIVREIAEQPELLDDFDWFNDYDDTKAWAEHSCPNMVEPLDDGFGEWQRERAKKWSGRKMPATGDPEQDTGTSSED